MALDWGIVASCTTAAVAVLALFVSIEQGRMANRQRLFDRRLKILIITEKLMQLYRDNSELLKKDNEPQLAMDVCFDWLTNTTYLQEISSTISHTLESEWQLKLHLKLDEMKSLSTEASFVFNGKPKVAIAEFVDAYQALLFAIYRYQIVLNKMQQIGEKYHLMLSKAIEKSHEEQYRATLFNAEDRLAMAYEGLADKWLISEIRRQIRLDSTFSDYLSTFR